MTKILFKAVEKNLKFYIHICDYHKNGIMSSLRAITGWKFTAFLLIVILISGFIMPALADESRKKYLVETTYDKSVTSNYEEVKQLKETTLITLEVMSPSEVTATTEEWVELVWEIIDAFNELQKLSSSRDLSKHISAVSKAQAMKSDIERLGDYSQASENAIPILPEIALTRFFNDQGDYFEKEATEEKSTKSRIECLEQSKIAYHEGGRISDSSRLDYETKMLAMRYNLDVEVASREMSSAEDYLSKAEMCRDSSDFITVIGGFMDAKKASEHVEKALKIYRGHEDEKVDYAISIKERVDAVNAEFGKKSGGYFATLAAIFILMTVYALRSVGRWVETMKDTRLGDELIAI